jgi:hypothetical protein
MTSVLYSAGLNYQGGNPIGNQVRSVQSNVTDLRKLIDTQAIELNLLKAQHAVVRKELDTAIAAITTLKAAASTTIAPTTAPTTTPV